MSDQVTESTTRAKDGDAAAQTAKVVVVMPARQAALTLRETFSDIPLDEVSEIIVVDDSSTDETVKLARELPVQLVWHPHQVGYGGNQKTCYLQALQHDADVVVMLHPDGQYEPGLIPEMVKPIVEGRADLVLGSRLLIPGAALDAGMPRWKYAGQQVPHDDPEPDHGHPPLRGPHRLPGLFARAPAHRARSCGTHSTSASTPELLYQAAEFGFRIEEVPARCRYFEEASSVGFKTGVVYGLKTIWAGVRLLLHRWHIVPSRKYRR